jgi:hypothetical protein
MSFISGQNLKTALGAVTTCLKLVPFSNMAPWIWAYLLLRFAMLPYHIHYLQLQYGCGKRLNAMVLLHAQAFN